MKSACPLRVEVTQKLFRKARVELWPHEPAEEWAGQLDGPDGVLSVCRYCGAVYIDPAKKPPQAKP